MLSAEKPSDASYARVAAAQLPLRQALQTYSQVGRARRLGAARLPSGGGSRVRSEATGGGARRLAPAHLPRMHAKGSGPPAPWPAPLPPLSRPGRQLVNLWRGCVSHMASMEFGAAAEMIHGMESMALAFYKMCQEVWGRGDGVPGGSAKPRGGGGRAAGRAGGLQPRAGMHGQGVWAAGTIPAPPVSTGWRRAQRAKWLRPVPAAAHRRPHPPPWQAHELFHPQRCADRTPIPAAFLRWVLFGSAAAVVLTVLITCRPRRKSKRV